MREPTIRYKGKDIIIYFTVPRCTHVAECITGAPAVFDTTRKPWIIADAEPVDNVACVIEKCPTGALHYKRLDGGAEEKIPIENILQVEADGPIYFHGDIIVKDEEGNKVLEDTRLAFCRCGKSEHKPLCDDKHELYFEDPGEIARKKTAYEKPEEPQKIEAFIQKGGALFLSGPVTIKNADGEIIVQSKNKTALCRCGASKKKPFCDGAHTAIKWDE